MTDSSATTGPGVVPIFIEVAPTDIALLKFLFESYEGVAVVRTLDKRKAVIVALVSRDFEDVARGMLRYPAAERHTARWQVGDDIDGWTFLFGIIPFSVHRLQVTVVDAPTRVIETEENGGLVTVWRHHIDVEPLDERRCRYTDRIEVGAGALTAVAAAYARIFYRYRQRRWRRLAQVLAATWADGATR